MSVPIIGQPVIGDWVFTFNIQCSCGNQFLFSGKPGNVAGCAKPGCHRVYQLGGMPTLAPNGNIQVPLGVGYMSPQEPGT